MFRRRRLVPNAYLNYNNILCTYIYVGALFVDRRRDKGTKGAARVSVDAVCWLLDQHYIRDCLGSEKDTDVHSPHRRSVGERKRIRCKIRVRGFLPRQKHPFRTSE